MSRLHRTISLAGAATLGLALLAGCSRPGTITMSSSAPTGAEEAFGRTIGGSAPGTATLAALRSAGAATSAVGSGRYETTLGDGDGNVFMTLIGEFSGDRTHQTTVLAAGDLLGGDAPADGLTTEMITDGSTLYLGGSLFAEMAGLFGGDEPAPADAEWFSFEVPDGEGSGLDVTELFSGFGQGLSRETAELLSGAYGDVTTIGTEDVRGVSTTHSRVDIEPGRIVGDAGGLADDLGDGSIPVDVWLGEDGLVHRMRFELSAAALGVPGADDSSMVSTFELWDVGTDVTIDVPEHATPFDLGELFGGR